MDRVAHETLALLAYCKAERRDDTGLESLVERAMARATPDLREHPDLLLGEMHVAEFLLDRGHADLAEEVARHVIERLRVERATPLLFGPLIMLASAVRELGQLDEALDLAYLALDAAEKDPEEYGYWAASALAEIGINLHHRNRLEEAEEKVLEAVWIFDELGEPDRPHHIGALRTLGMIRLQRGDYSGAETPLKEIIAVYRKRQPAESRTLGLLLSQLGKAYLGSERIADADEALREAYSLLAESPVPNDEWLRWTLDDWIAVQKLLGNAEEVAKLEQLRRDQ